MLTGGGCRGGPRPPLVRRQKKKKLEDGGTVLSSLSMPKRSMDEKIDGDLDYLL